MTRTELHQLGCRLRALGSTRGDWLDYIDGTLPLLTMVPPVMIAPKAELARPTLECLTCTDRRRKKAKAQKNWRQRAKEQK
jgi:hypothetical protein